jgi:hypothetical protein
VAQNTKTGENVTNDDKMYQTAMKHTKGLQNISKGHKIYQHCLIPDPRTSIINPNRDIWFENIPSGNPAFVHGCQIFLGPNIPKWEKYTK